MLKLLEDDSYSQRMKTELKKVWDILGSKEASVNAAEMIKLTAGI